MLEWESIGVLKSTGKLMDARTYRRFKLKIFIRKIKEIEYNELRKFFYLYAYFTYTYLFFTYIIYLYILWKVISISKNTLDLWNIWKKTNYESVIPTVPTLVVLVSRKAKQAHVQQDDCNAAF